MNSKNLVTGYYSKDSFTIISKIDGEIEEECKVTNEDNEYSHSQMFMMCLMQTRELAEFYGCDYEFYNKPAEEIIIK